MGENVHLCRPSIDLQNEYISFYEEWVNCGEELEGMAPWVISRDPADFHRMIESILNKEKVEYLPDGGVPSSTYWLVTDSRKVVGSVNIRHSLTTFGHIGYGIRPSERRKGYATKLLALSLLKAMELGIEKVLVIAIRITQALKRQYETMVGFRIQDTLKKAEIFYCDFGSIYKSMRPKKTSGMHSKLCIINKGVRCD